MTAVLPLVLPLTASVVHGGALSGLSGSNGGVYIIRTNTVMRDTRVMRDTLRMIDNG